MRNRLAKKIFVLGLASSFCTPYFANTVYFAGRDDEKGAPENTKSTCIDQKGPVTIQNAAQVNIDGKFRQKMPAMDTRLYAATVILVFSVLGEHLFGVLVLQIFK